MNGTPVSPSVLTMVSALPAAVRAAERELHVGPPDAGVGQRAADGDRALLHPGQVVAAERVDADPDDGDVIHELCSPRSTGAKANVTTSRPSVVVA